MDRFSKLSLFACSALACLALAACEDDTSTSDASVADSGVRDQGVADLGGEITDLALPDRGIAADAEPTDNGEHDGGMTEEEIVIPGLTSTVTVDYDDHAIAHIRCRTNLDCVSAQGYVHASQRFGEMDLRRRFVRGRLSELFGLLGDPVLALDKQSRLFIATRDGGRLEQQMWDNANAETKEAITAYTRGVNAWVADLAAHKNGAKLTDDWPIPDSFASNWEELDTAACMLGLLEDLTNDSGAEISAGALLAQVPPDLFMDLYGLRPASEATILPQPTMLRARPPAALPAVEAARPRLADARVLLRDAARRVPDEEKHADGFGSNNWIVAPSQTPNNKALLANDPHLGLENPPIWYVNSLDASDGDLHVAGVSFVGVPGVILGHNEHIAWGATTTFFDMADVYLETTTQNDTAVSFEGNDVPLVVRDETFEQLGFGTQHATFYYVPHHGPVVAADPANHSAISIHWVGHEADTDLNFLYSMMLAQNVTEAKAALRNLTATGQNFIVADVDGNIGWFPFSRVPNRPWAEQYPPYLPLPGTGAAEWQGYIPYDDLPQSENPAEGYLATANGDMTGALQDGDPLNDGLYLQHFVADGYRQERILQRLSNDAGNLTRDTMSSIQADVRSLIGEDVVPVVLMLASTATTVDRGGSLVVAALESWDYECPTGLMGLEPDSAYDPDQHVAEQSEGCFAFHTLLPRLNRAVFDDEIAAAGVDRRARIDTLVQLLTRPDVLIRGSAYWDDVATPQVETPEVIVARALNETGAYLVATYGTPDDWRWGKIHTVTLEAQFVDAINIGPLSNDGGYSTVDVGNPRGLYSDNYAQSAGPSMRLACELDRTSGVQCTIQLPGGQRTFTDDPFFDDLFQLWLRNTTYDLYFDDAEVTAHSASSVSITNGE